LNYYRSLAKLNPVVEDPALSNGDRAHAAYIVKNFGDRIAHGGLGAEMHTEDPGREGFTPAGLEAAKSSDVDVWFMEGPAGEGAGTADPDEWTKERAPGSPQWSIDGWMSIPFHRMPMLNPTLSSAGFGFYCESGACASALNLMSGAKRSPSAAGVASPIEFPPDGSTIGMRSFGNEWPDPLTNCAGYAPPTGLAITLQLGTWLDTKLSDYSVVRENADGANDTSIESCGYGSSDYSNPDANLQELGRGILKTSGAVVVVPRAPLDKGAKYAVSVTVNGTVYAWRFSIPEINRDHRGERIERAVGRQNHQLANRIGIEQHVGRRNSPAHFQRNLARQRPRLAHAPDLHAAHRHRLVRLHDAVQIHAVATPS
jgi:hypothetical protein